MKAYSVIVLVMAGVIAFSAVAEQGGGSTDKVTITLKSAAEVSYETFAAGQDARQAQQLNVDLSVFTVVGGGVLGASGSF